MAFDMLQIDSVNPLSAPVFAQDCSFPITNWIQYVPPDDVLANMPIRLQSWPDSTTAPQITGVSYAIDTTGVGVDNCDLPVVTADMTSCDQVVPNMKFIGVQSPSLNIRDMREDFCRRRRILPSQLCLFNPDGSFAVGEDVALSRAWFNFVMNTVVNAHAMQLYHSALVGDDSATYEFDGVYTQLEGGWGNVSGNPGNCDTNFNTEAVIDWADLTGNGPNPAPPEAKTVDGATVTIWGTSFDVDADLTLPEVLERYWFDKVQHDWTANRGGVTQWEMHMPYGMHACIARAASCVQPCAPSEVVAYINDADLRDRYARMLNDKAVTLYPSNRRVPVFESNLMPANTIRLGPRSVGGRPTYGLFFDDINRLFTQMGGFDFEGGAGYPTPMGFFPPASAPDIRTQLESAAIRWNIFRTSEICFRASVLALAGVIVCSRHLWLRVNNVKCTNWLSARPLPITVDTVVLS